MLARGLVRQAGAARLSLHRRPPLVQRLVSTFSRTSVVVPRSVLAAAAAFTIVGAATKYAWSMPPKKKKALWPQTFSCAECGKEGRLVKRKKTKPPPELVRCFSHGASARHRDYVMKPDKAEEAAEALRRTEDAAAKTKASARQAQATRLAHVAAIVKARPRPTEPALAAANAKLAKEIKEGLQRPNPLTHGDGRVCGCNHAINLEAMRRPPAVLQTFMFLCGATPARTKDIVAMPTSWLRHAAALWAVLHAERPGEVDPYAFVGLNALERQATHPDDGARYGTIAAAYDNDEGGRDLPDELRVSVASFDLSEMLLPYLSAKEGRDALGRIENVTVGHVGYTISRFPVELAGRKTVMSVMHMRRQISLPAIDFHPVRGVWSPRMTDDFNRLASLSVPATIHRLIKTCKVDGEDACAIVHAFKMKYGPVLDAIDALLRSKYQRLRAVLL
mmetsp:Transcript_21910/g.57182  ORF Transcript_21910/g.57182 Transcript_21910/m.57182 type:complete len:448 (-) Transcript_21910:404-1747(-)